MADEIKWIKLSTGILDDEKIIAIEDLPDGPCLCWMWIKLLALAGRQNNDGRISLTEEIPYTEGQLAKRFRMETETVRTGLELFQQYGMIEIIDDFIYTSNWSKHQSVDGMEKIREQNRIRKANQRERQKKNLSLLDATDKTAVQRRFERWYKEYPKKIGRGAAEKSFYKYKPDEALTDQMIQAVKVQKTSRRWKEGYIPNPATWLNQKRWMDEVDEEPLPFTDPPAPAYIRDESIEDWN